MNPVLVGSQALQFWLGDKPKPDSDWDIIRLDRTAKKIQNVEIIPANLLNNAELVLAYTPDSVQGPTPGFERFVLDSGVQLPDGLCPRDLRVMRPEGLKIMKRSHLHRPLNFQKHMHQYKYLGALHPGFTELGRGFLKERTALTKAEYGDKVPSLNQTNEDFFDDAVHKYFVHDDLHILMRHLDTPIYEKLKRDKHKARCEKDLWEELPHDHKILCVLEESYVIALERFLVPLRIKDGRKMPPKMAVHKALRKVCTTLTSGWFRDFAIDNYYEIYDRVDADRVLNFFNSELWRNECYST